MSEKAPFAGAHRATALALMAALRSAVGARLVHYAHAHALTLARTDAALAAALAAADAVLPDGVGIRVAAALLGKQMRDNVNGTDMLPLLCRRAAAEGVPLVLVGARPGVAEACATHLRAAHAGLQIPIAVHGYLAPAEIEALRAAVRGLGRCLVLVGMGSPVQERWARAPRPVALDR